MPDRWGASCGPDQMKGEAICARQTEDLRKEDECYYSSLHRREPLLQMRTTGRKRGECPPALSLLFLEACHAWAVDVLCTEDLTHKSLV